MQNQMPLGTGFGPLAVRLLLEPCYLSVGLKQTGKVQLHLGNAKQNKSIGGETPCSKRRVGSLKRRDF